MKKLFLLLIVIVFSLKAHSQFINLQSGVSISKLNQCFNNFKIGYSGYLGVEYLETKVFNLNTNIGFISKGGIYQQPIHADNGTGNISGYQKQIQNFNYLSLNTTFELRY